VTARARSWLGGVAGLAALGSLGGGVAMIDAVARPGRAEAAEWLQLGSRALPRGAWADPDAPATGIAYGPRGSSRAGADVALVTWRSDERTRRLGLSAVVGFDNAVTRSPLAGELGRTAVELAIASSFDGWAARHLGARGVLELGLAVGRRSAFSTERYLLGDAPRADDVPFGAGGSYLGLDAAARTGLRAAWDLGVRLALRAYLNAFPDLVGSREASDVVADSLHEGAEWQGSVEARVDRRFGARARGYLSLYAEAIAPHDDSAKGLWLGRLEAGVALTSNALEVAFFVAGEAGHGPSLLVNQTELRLLGGVKIYAR